MFSGLILSEVLGSLGIDLGLLGRPFPSLAQSRPPRGLGDAEPVTKQGLSKLRRVRAAGWALGHEVLQHQTWGRCYGFHRTQEGCQ